MAAVQLGSVREVWLAPVSNPSDKNSFLIRDDAYSMQGQAFGRTIRLGDPVNLGPNSSWTQLSWEGGVKQEVWSDKAMFQEGSADPQTKPGKLRLWTGWQGIYAQSGRMFDHFKFARSASGDGGTTRLYIAESNKWRTTTPGGGFQIVAFDPVTSTSPVKYFPGGPSAGTQPFRAMLGTYSNSAATGTLCVTNLNSMWFLFENNNAWVKDTGAFSGPYGHDCLLSYNDAIYYVSNNALCKRTAGTGPLGLPGVHSIVRQIVDCLFFGGLTLYNNRIYYFVQYPGGRAAVEVSDGVSAQRVFEFPDEFWPKAMVAHYGSLYIVGGKPAASGPTTKGNPPTALGQEWRYNGSSLVKLWDDGDPRDGLQHGIEAVTTFGQNLVWTRNGFGGSNTATSLSGSNGTNRPCLMFYDAEQDAIFEGPGIDFPTGSSGVVVANVTQWDNTLVACFVDQHGDYTGGAKAPCLQAAYVRLNDTVRNVMSPFAGNTSFASLNSGTKTQFVLSSRYNGEDDVALEVKTWLSAKLRVRVPPNTQVRLAVLLDEGTEQAVSTITTDGTSNWRTLTVPLKVGGSYLQSTNLQYKLYLDNTDTSANSQAVPEVDDLYVQWRVAPTFQRTWRVRCETQDAQLRLDGTANPLTTRDLMDAKLQEYYEAGVPVLFWDAEADGSVPGGSGTEVVVTDFLSQPFRVDTSGAATVGQVSLTLTENVV